MKRAMRAIVSAFSYFSVLPVIGGESAPAPDADSLLALPLVGAVIGTIAGLGARLTGGALGELSAPTAFGLSIALSGAMHVDGFLDCSDAVFSSAGVERRLEILKDPHHGSFAVAAMAVVSAVWIAGLQSVEPRRLPAVLAYSAALSRYAAIVNRVVFRPAAGNRSTGALRDPLRVEVLLSEVVVMGIAARMLGPRVWLTLPLAVVCSLGAGQLVARRFGGALSGDAYGFLVVGLEPPIIALTAALGRS